MLVLGVTSGGLSYIGQRTTARTTGIMSCHWKRELIQGEWVTTGPLEQFRTRFPDFVASEKRRCSDADAKEAADYYVLVTFPPWPVFSFSNLAETLHQTGFLSRTTLAYNPFTTGIVMLCASNVLESISLVGETALRMPFSEEVVSQGEGTEAGGRWDVYTLADWQFSALVRHSLALQRASKLSREWFDRRGLRADLAGCVRDRPKRLGIDVWTPVFRVPSAGLELYRHFQRVQQSDSKNIDAKAIELETDHVYATYTESGGRVREYTSRNSIVVMVSGHGFVESEYGITPRSDRDRAVTALAPFHLRD